MSADFDWNPSIFNDDIYDVETFYDVTDDITIHHGAFYRYGEYWYRMIASHNTRSEPEFSGAVEILDHNDMAVALLQFFVNW
jgi:hypothetical protein